MSKTSSLRSLLRNRRGYRLLQQKLLSIARALVPAVIALSFATVAHAQGTMDFSGAQTLTGACSLWQASTPRAAPMRIWTFAFAASKPPCADSRKAPASTNTPVSSPASISPGRASIRAVLDTLVAWGDSYSKHDTTRGI